MGNDRKHLQIIISSYWRIKKNKVPAAYIIPPALPPPISPATRPIKSAEVENTNLFLLSFAQYVVTRKDLIISKYKTPIRNEYLNFPFCYA